MRGIFCVSWSYTIQPESYVILLLCLVLSGLQLLYISNQFSTAISMHIPIHSLHAAPSGTVTKYSYVTISAPWIGRKRVCILPKLCGNKAGE